MVKRILAFKPIVARKRRVENYQRVGYPFIHDDAVEEKKREPVESIHPIIAYATIMEFKKNGEPSSVETNNDFFF